MHRCYMCGLSVVVGDRYVRQTLVDGAEIWNSAAHVRCSANYWAYWRWVGLGLRDVDDDCVIDDSEFRQFLSETYKSG